ncbi:MAG: DcaP family trimeric outer membrane transporter, partial [Kiritimatiellaeota bacterium]|nr:DcaP family trimeric outer membrane transporter [Kiritimatiellota bacterium]
RFFERTNKQENMKKWNTGLYWTVTVIVMACIAPVASAADDAAALKAQNDALRLRVDKLSGEMEQVKTALAEKGVPVTEKKSVDVQFYGTIKLDAARDDSRTSVGNFARWVESEGALKNDDQFSMTANQTRLGVLVNGPAQGTIKGSGQVEIDFYGNGAAENKPDAMLRHAFLKADWTDLNFSILAGQTFDIISPLTMPTVNYTVGWWQGNIGYRRPQIRLTQGVKLADDVELKLEGGPTRTVTDRKFVYTSATDVDSGADAGFPTIQGRASLSFPSFNGKAATVGVSGHWGREELNTTNASSLVSSNTEIPTWSGNVDVRLPLTDWLLLQGEGFVGKNLSAYLGGIGQGFDVTRNDGIGAKGGWAAATFGPCGKWQFNLGIGVDEVDEADVSANVKAPPRLTNLVYFGNGSYALTANLQVALEISYLKTTYKNAPNGDDWREQLAAIYKF